ncbi:hypothetical protein EYR38_010663 [Pleurotus pulmonarius]|nr:hypothetical protein EYR38_010663 [Pleurotus pulmonarius]
MKPSTIAHDSFVHLREEEEESSESSSAEVGISGAATQAISSASTMSSASTNKHTSQVNVDAINHTTGSYRKAGNDGKGLDSIRKVCLEVLRKTWDEFYEWEREYCEAKLAALMDERRKGARVKTTTTITAEAVNPSSPPAPVLITLSSENMLDLSDAFADFDADPKYESCTPLYGNVHIGDDPDMMPFLPFGEEDWDGYPLPDGERRRFSYEGYIKEYSKLAWMSEFDDPDLDCILYATTQRLLSMSISYEQMAAIGVFARVSRLPLLSASPSDHYGLEARAARRVFPPFPGLPSSPAPRPPAPSILLTFKPYIFPFFCHNLTCIRHICPTHSDCTPYPHPTTPKKKSVELADVGQIIPLLADVLPTLWRWTGTKGHNGRAAVGSSGFLAVEVRQSAHGYGLFLKESVVANEFLMEYTGEAILEPTCVSRDHLIIHRQRNYLFSLHKTLSIDSSLAGDPSRFINHGNPPTSVDGYTGAGEGIANVHSRVEITNGGHGIMIYAAVDMDAGTELLLDYGPNFFKQLHGGDDDDDDDGDGADNEGVAVAEEEEGAGKFIYWDDDPEYGEEQEYRE